MNPIRIVTVDDYSAITDLLEEYLFGEPFQILAHCQTGHRALLRVHTLKPDLVITHVWLPDMSGFELAKHLKRQYPQVKIMAISVQDYEAEASQAGIDAFVSKDQLHDELVPMLRGLFGRRVRDVRLPLTTKRGGVRTNRPLNCVKQHVAAGTKRNQLLEDLLDELWAINVWDRYYCFQQTRDEIDKVARQARRRRLAEIQKELEEVRKALADCVPIRFIGKVASADQGLEPESNKPRLSHDLAMQKR